MATNGDQIETSTFVFADLAGFTALTEAHGDSTASRIAADFVTSVRRILTDYDAEEVKTIGDEVMIRAADPKTAVRIGLRSSTSSPSIARRRFALGCTRGRRSTATGTGLAPRLMSPLASLMQQPGEVLLTDATRSQLGDGFDLSRAGCAT